MDYFDLYSDFGVILDNTQAIIEASCQDVALGDFVHPTVYCTFGDFIKNRVWEDELIVIAPDFRFMGNVGLARMYLKPLLSVRGGFNPMIKGVFVIG